MNETPSLKRQFKLPGSDKLMDTINRFGATEKVIFFIFVVIFSLSALTLAYEVNGKFLVAVPAAGGTLQEGVVGTPRFINPVLAISDVDRDLTTLVYSGLMKVGENGLVPDLAEKYTVSDDGLTYDFTLRNNIYFHDGSPVTADDVVFTITKAQDPVIKSPKRANWDGVTVEKVSAKEVKFTLKRPYAPFIENTTLGILPRHIWKNVEVEQFTYSQYNVEPVGSGPFIISSVFRDSGGLPQSYELVSNKKYAGGRPYISNLVFRFFSNEKLLIEGYNEGIIESMNSLSPSQAEKLQKNDTVVVKAPLPRVFGVFFNQNQAPVLANKEVRQALNMVADRDAIVKEVLLGYGTKIYSPIPAGILEATTTSAGKEISDMAYADRVSAAKSLLAKNGWSEGPDGVLQKKSAKGTDTMTLEFSISTSNAPELKQTAEMLKNEWRQIGAKVNVRIFETGDLNQNVIRPRKYDSLLFGEIIGRDLDLFAFWHSSQRNDPGLNIANYVSGNVDKLLDDARATSDMNVRLQKFEQIEEAIYKDVPAVFVYSPDFIYAVPKSVHNVTLSRITTPADRFDGVSKWYINTDEVWRVFVKDQAHAATIAQ